MKKISLIAITVLTVAGTVYACVAASKYWQDGIPKATMEWRVAYGDGDFSQVAFNINSLLRSNVKQAQAIIQLNGRLVALEAMVVDSNDVAVGDPNAGSE